MGRIPHVIFTCYDILPEWVSDPVLTRYGSLLQFVGLDHITERIGADYITGTVAWISSLAFSSAATVVSYH